MSINTATSARIIPIAAAGWTERQQHRQQSACAGLWDLLDAVKDPEVPALSLWFGRSAEAELMRDYLPVGFSLLILIELIADLLPLAESRQTDLGLDRAHPALLHGDPDQLYTLLRNAACSGCPTSWKATPRAPWSFTAGKTSASS